MARLYTEDFESGTSGWTTTNGSPTIVTTQANTGTHSLRCNPTGGVASISKTCTAVPDTGGNIMYLRTYIYIATAPSATITVLGWADNPTTTSGFFGLRLRNGRTLIATSSTGITGTASATMALNTWYRLEIEYDDNANTLKGYLDGVNFSGTVTSVSLGGGAYARMGAMQTSTTDLFFDDFAVNDSTTGSDNGLPGAVVTTTPISDSDTGSGGEATPVIGVSDLDTSAGTETQTLAVALPGTDTATGAEVESLAVTTSDLDTSLGTETASIALSDTDTALGTETHTLDVTTSDTDTGLASETVVIGISDSDTSSGVETEGTSQGAADADSNSGADTESLAATLTDTDTALSAESSSISAGLPDVDTGSGTESATISLSDADTSLSTDTEALGPSTPDTSSGADTESLAAALSDLDIGTGSESHSLLVQISDGDTAAGVDSESVSVNTTTPQDNDGTGGAESWSIQVFSPTATDRSLVMGPGTLYLGAYGALEPALGSVDTLPDLGAWTDLGGLLGGVELTVDQEFDEITFTQMPDMPSRRLKRRKLSVKTSMAEATLTNLGYILNDSPGVSGTTYTPSSIDEATQLTYVAIICDGWRPGFHYTHRQKRRRVIMRKCLSIDNIELSYTKDGQSVFTVTWSCHYVDASTAPFRVVDEA